MKKTITFLMLLGTLIAAWAADATFFGGQGSEPTAIVYNRTDEGMSMVANFGLNGVDYQFNYSYTFQTYNEVAYVVANSLQSENIGLYFYDNDWNAFDMTAVGTYTVDEDILVSSGLVGIVSGTLVIAQNQDGQYTYTFTGVAYNGDQWTLTAVSGALPAVTDTVDVALSNVAMYAWVGEYEFRLEQGEGDDYIYFHISYLSESVVSDINSENLYGFDLYLGDQNPNILTLNGTVTAIENGYHGEAFCYSISGTVYHVTFDWTLSADVVTVTSDQMRFFEQWGERLYIGKDGDLVYQFRVESNEDGEDVIVYAYIRDFNAGYDYAINVTSQSITIGENNLAHVMFEGYYTVDGQRFSFDLLQHPAQRIDLTFDEVEYNDYYEASDGEHSVAVRVYRVGELGPNDFWMRYNEESLSDIRATVTPMGPGAIIDAWGLYYGDTIHVVMNYNLPTNVNEFVSNNVTLDGNTMTATSAEGYSVYFYTWNSLQDDMILQLYSQMEVSLAMNNNEISLSEAMANISHDEITTICDLWMHDVDGAWYHTVMTYTPQVDTTNIVATYFEMDENYYPGYTYFHLQTQNGDYVVGLIPGAAADIQSGLTYNIEAYAANINYTDVNYRQVNFTLTRSEEGYVTVIVKAFDFDLNLYRWIYVPVMAKDTIELQFDSTFRNGNMYAGFDYMIDEEVGIPHNAMAIEYNNGEVDQQNSMIIYNGTPIQVMDANVTNVLETDSVIVLDAYLMGTDTVMYHSVMTFHVPVENFVGIFGYVYFLPATENGTGIDLWEIGVSCDEEYFFFDIIADSVVPGHTYTLEDMYFSLTRYGNYNTYQWIDYRTAQMTLTYDEEGLMHIDANVTLVNGNRYHVVYNQLSPSAAKDTVELVFDNAQFYNRIEENGFIIFSSEDENDYVLLYTNTVEGSYNEYNVHTFNVSNTANGFLSFNATVSAVGEGLLLDCYVYGVDTVMYHIVMKYNITEALYTVTAQSSNNAMGTVTGAGVYNYGATATLVATANAHYHFVNWSNGDTTATISVVVNGDMNLTANFAIDQHNVAVAANDTVMGTVTGAGVYNYGATATLVATANAHYHFVNWSNGDTTATISVTVNDDMNLTANFAIDQHNVTVAANDTVMGTVTGAGEYNYGATATLVATAKAHYHFVNWSNGDTTATISVVVNGDTTLTANFAGDLFTVSAMVNDSTMGTVAGAGEYNYGATATLVATANAHYHFVNWSNGDTTATISVTVNGDTTFTANFAIDQYNVIATANDTVMGTVTGAGVYTYGDTATLVATANEGYHFVRWSNGDTAATITIVVDENMELEAIFEQNQTQGIDNVDASEIVVSVSNCSISVSGANNQMLYIFDVNGRMIVRESAVDHKQYRMPSTGVYLVKVGNRPAQKVVMVR